MSVEVLTGFVGIGNASKSGWNCTDSLYTGFRCGFKPIFGLAAMRSAFAFCAKRGALERMYVCCFGNVSHCGDQNRSDLAYVLVQVPCLLHHPCRLPPAFSQDCSVGGIVSIEFDGSSILDGGIVDSNLLPTDSA
jgi:hypothetical protein